MSLDPSSRTSEGPLTAAAPVSAPIPDEQWWALERRVSRLHLFLLSGPCAMLMWVYAVFLVVGVWRLAQQPVVHEPGSSIDAGWLMVLLPAMWVPTIVVWSFVNWLGWQFFRHN
jgi:hypothetical protein